MIRQDVQNNINEIRRIKRELANLHIRFSITEQEAREWNIYADPVKSFIAEKANLEAELHMLIQSVLDYASQLVLNSDELIEVSSALNYL